MRRREFIGLFGGAAWTGWPSAVFSQSAFRLGLLSAPAPISDSSPFGAALVKGLARNGYSQGRNLVIERRGAEGHLDRLPRLVEELAAIRVDAIVTNGYPATLAAKRGTAIPIVAINAGDPVGTGLVASLASPGGTLTGISDVSAELTPKRMELLRLIAPDLRRVAILWNSTDLGMTLRYQALDASAKIMGISVQPLGVREPDDFEEAFSSMSRDKPDAILMVTDSLTNLNRRRVFDYAASHRLPAIYEFDTFVRDGGLMSYGPDQEESLGRVANLIDRIFKGAKPAELPFEQPTRFKLAINLKTAKALGIAVPPTLLALADEVIE
jgi:putative ABC transport system substrate-binding protein